MRGERILLISLSCGSIFFFFSSRRRHTRLQGDWSSDVCSSDLYEAFTSQPRVPEKPLGPKTSCVKMTPGVSDISMYVWRPFSGNSWVLIVSKTDRKSVV